MTIGSSVNSAYLFKRGDNVSNVSLIVIIIAGLIIVTGFIWLIRIILGLQKNINKLVLDTDKENENVISNTDNPVMNTTIMSDAKEQDINTQDEIKNIREEYQDVIEIDKMINSYLAKSDDNDEGEAPDFHEVNIVKVNKTDGIQTESVDPNRMSLTSSGQPYKLDIVIEKTPIDKVLKNEYVERKR
jgi:hypothetical protein